MSGLPAVPSLPLSCLVVDDDPTARQVLMHCIAQTPVLHAAGTCGSALEALDFLRVQPVEVLFLDVHMPLVSGIELLHLLLHQLPRLPHTVLVTSSADHAPQAFDYAVVDYLLKPITMPRFTQAVHRVQALAATTHTAIPDPIASQGADFLFVKVGNQQIRVNFAEVCYLESSGSYVHIITQQQRHTIFATLRSLVQRFPSRGFFSPHRCYLVNLRYVETVEERSLFIRNKWLPISSLLRAQLLEQLNVL